MLLSCCSVQVLPPERKYGRRDDAGRFLGRSGLTQGLGQGRTRCALYACTSDVVLKVAKARGWQIVMMPNESAQGNTDVVQVASAHVHWVGRHVEFDIPRNLPHVEPWMRINCFPGIARTLACKAGLARTLRHTQNKLIPESWVFPDDERRFAEQMGVGLRPKTFIVKPVGESMGRGIFLSQDFEEVLQRTASKRVVVQRYIDDPLLLDGLKFDLRLYLLVGAVPSQDTDSLNLRGYLFQNGLLRLCTLPYEQPTPETSGKRRMHLTNYSINKGSVKFKHNVSVDEDGSGHKRSLRWFLNNFAETHGNDASEELWTRLCTLCSDTLAAARPNIQKEYFKAFPSMSNNGEFGCRCFQLLGLDVLLDSEFHPWLIEVNQTPSLSTPAPLDEYIKKRVLEQTFAMTCADAPFRWPTPKSNMVSAGPTEVVKRLNRLVFGDFVQVFPSTGNHAAANAGSLAAVNADSCASFVEDESASKAF